ncbi:MAG: DUF1127 domain-containing protein [Rhizobiaceae bacterium]|nr:DUF1127 domain-containing protein [Rhizobiaceae bacterium]
MRSIGTTTMGGHRSSTGGRSLLKTLEWVEGMLERRRTRLALMEMSDAQLKDIGVSRSDAFGEAGRPFWK